MTAFASDQPSTADPTGSVATTACRLYEAECQLHAAHQSHVDAWIVAASEKLHQAVEEHLAAVRASQGAGIRVAS